jgi:AcrR family transcriptional regulator
LREETVASKSRPPRKARAVAPRLTRDDWLDASFSAVVEGGFDKVRVLTLANALGVTRGSFYWHFSEQSDLVDGLLQRWRERQLATHRAVEAESATADPKAALRHMLETALAHVGNDLEHMRFELALRGLGRRDRAVARALVEVDEMRMALFQRHFLQLTGDGQTATELATLFYLAVVGSHQALSRPVTPAWLKDHLEGLIAKYLIEAQAPASGRGVRRRANGAKPNVARRK